MDATDFGNREETSCFLCLYSRYIQFRKEFCMTERIYYEDAYCREFTALVKSCACRKTDGLFEVVLDRTAFYPEGGGQNGDRGELIFDEEKNTWAVQLADAAGDQENHASKVRVLDTIEGGEEIIHLCDGPVAPGTRLTGKIDWQFRFDLMQNHTGEHIVSGLIHAAFGYNNVGFHMGSDFITIDLDGELDHAQLAKIEEQANECIWKDVETKIITFSHDEAAKVDYRSKKELEGDVRVVFIPGADSCACCGTHVKRTGEIGLIRLFSCQKLRGGVRIEMLCGRKALLYMSEIREQNHEISVLLSAPPLQTADAVRRMKQQYTGLSEKMYGMELEAIASLAKQMENKGNVMIFREDEAPDQVRRAADAVMHTCGGICCVFSGNDETGYKYAIGKEEADLREFIRTINAKLNGRGGGRPHFAQGSVSADRASIKALLHSEEKAWVIVG